MTPIPKIGLLADDFTGAMDSGAQFAASNLGVYFRFAGQPGGDVEIINTASREISASEAVARNLEACRLLAGRHLFKKIDSTLRGHVGAEVAAVLSASAYQRAIICSAVPQQARTISGGVLYVNGLPLDQTSFRNDPVYPAKTAVVAQIIKSPTVHLPLELVRSPLENLVSAIAAIEQPLLSADAETEQDLYVVARAALATNALPCGAFGLAKAYLQSLDAAPAQQVHFRPEGPVLVLVGSANQVARQQVASLEALPGSQVLKLDPTASPSSGIFDVLTPGKRVLVLCAAQDKTVRTPAWLGFGKTVSEIGLELVGRFQPRTILIVGGETVTHFCGLARSESIQILGEALPGVPFGRIRGGRLDGLILVTKAGGFGRPDTLANILYPQEEQ